MGWASGSEMAEELFKELKKMVPKTKHQKLAQLLVDKFEDHDADDWDMSRDSLYLTAYPDGRPEDYNAGYVDLDDEYEDDAYDDDRFFEPLEDED